MKSNFLSFVFLICIAATANAQVPYLEALPNGPSKKAVTTERVGLTDITITYHRPSVSGREGKIWGTQVHTGFVKQGFGANNPSPWRAGANENTIFECTNDIMVEGKSLPKGKYGFFIAYGTTECTVIFSKKYDGWGSYFYDEKDDILRVSVKSLPADKSVEWLRYEFTSQTENSATIQLEWEKLAIPFKVEVDYLKQQFDAIGTDMKNPRGFTWESLTAAANWCLSRNYQLDKALVWAKLSSDSNSFGGDQYFNAISTTAQILDKLGRKAEALAEMKRAMPLGTMNDLHQYAKQLLSLKMNKEALEVFELNYRKNPQAFTANIGMARGLSANGDYKKALEFATRALPIAPNEANKQVVQGMIEKLKAGKDAN